MTFEVLFVCTGNICRSPIGERLFRARMDPHAPLRVASAGTNGLSGHSMDAASALALQELGGDPDGHSAQRIGTEHLAGADLILTMETEHRAVLVRADPLAFRKTFTLLEFGRLSAGLAPLAGPPTEQTLRVRVAEVAGRRGWVEPAEPGADEIGDPFGASLEVARLRAAEVSAAVDAVLSALDVAAQPAPRAG